MRIETGSKKIIFLISLFIGALYLFMLSSDLGDFGGDNAQYIFLAKSLATGRGYRAINLPGSPVHSQYPPVFPLLLAPIIYFFGNNLFLMHLLIIACAIASVYLIYKVIKDDDSEENALLVMIYAGLSPFLIISLLRILSEMPYFLFSLLTLFFIKKYADTNSVKNRYLFLSCLFMVITYFTRTVGISLFIAAIVYLIFGNGAVSLKIKLNKTFYVGIIFIIPFLLWNLRSLLIDKATPSYYNSFFLIDVYNPGIGYARLYDLLTRVNQNLIFYQDVIAGNIFYSGIYRTPISLLILSIFIFGFLFKFLTKRTLLEFYLLVYLFIILLWPYTERRFLLPVLFLIIYYFLVGLKEFLNLFSKIQLVKLNRILFSLVIIILAWSNFVISGKIIKVHLSKIYFPKGCDVYKDKRNFPCLNLSNYYEGINAYLNGFDDQSRLIIEVYYRYLTVSSWLKEGVSKDSIIACRKPTITSLFSNHKAACYPFVKSEQKIISWLKGNNINYIILDEFSTETNKYLLPVIIKNRKIFWLIKRMGGTLLLEVRQDVI
ncbi:MAG: glycosyltransferase family 39 protein [Candidatus Omnitrophota bacterium]